MMVVGILTRNIIPITSIIIQITQITRVRIIRVRIRIIMVVVNIIHIREVVMPVALILISINVLPAPTIRVLLDAAHNYPKYRSSTRSPYRSSRQPTITARIPTLRPSGTCTIGKNATHFGDLVAKRTKK